MNRVRQEKGWETGSTTVHYQDDHLAVVTETVQTPAVPEGKSWTTVRRKRAVVIGAVTAEGKFVLVRQERIPIRAVIWEMPAGQVDELDATADEVAATVLRELAEETGYELAPDGTLTALGDFFSSPGFTDEQGYFFLAAPVQIGRKREPDASIVEVASFTVAELRELIARNEIRDANTLGMCARMAARAFFSFAAPE